MIIGNNFTNNNNFGKKIINNNNNFIPNKSKTPNTKKNIFTRDVSSYQNANIMNKKEMNNKSLAMLNDRLEKGTITIEEFSKQCQKFSKKNNN